MIVYHSYKNLQISKEKRFKTIIVIKKNTNEILSNLQIYQFINTKSSKMNETTDRNESAENKRLLGDNASVPQIYGSNVPVVISYKIISF